jgi:hypothetical protein
MELSHTKNKNLSDEILIALNNNPGTDLKRLLTDAINYKYPGMLRMRKVYYSYDSQWQENWTPDNDDLYNALKAYNNRK